jgi:uncharacterized protein YcnI
VLALAVAALLLADAAPARADVSLQPDAVAPGRAVPVTVQVMNERAGDSTTRVELTFPSKPPIPWIDVVPVPDWSVRIERRRLDHPLDTPEGSANVAVTKVVWTGGPIKGGSLGRFTMRVGPLSLGANQMVFKARQTYESGHVVRWDDDPTLLNAPHPSPVLLVSRYAPSRAPGTPDPVDTPFNLSEKRAIDLRVQSLVRRGRVATPDDIQSGRWIALVALLVAAAGLVFAVLAFLNSRRGLATTPDAPPSQPREKGASIAG